MTPKRAVQVVITYMLATLACIPTSYVYCWLLADISIRLNWQKAAAVLWAIVVGTPSMLWVSRELGRLLGNKAQPQVSIVGGHSIPVSGATLADSVKLALAHKPRQSMAVVDQLAFRCGPVVLSESEMDTFLRGAWRRQMHGAAPLSRRYWLARGRLDKQQYEAVVSVLVACNLIRGTRRQGSKNSLRWPPAQTMSELRHRYS